jgi:small subunit ribosomal protein S3
MAVGETSGQVRPRRIVSAGGGRRRPELGEPGSIAAEAVVPVDAAETDETDEALTASVDAPATPPVDDALEKLLAEEEEIERRTREQHHEAPHFRKEVD